MSEVAVAERYVDWKHLDGGSFGDVFKAWDREGSRWVAIKQLRVPRRGSVEGLGPREVRILQQLDHVSIVRLHAFEPDLQRPDYPESRPSLVMEFVDGETLEEILKRRGAESLDPRPLRWSVPIARVVLRALRVAHQCEPSIIHRDIKPANVMVSTDGHVKVLDFGLARHFTSATATTAGTPAYWAPEQPWGKASVQSDLYSVGAVLFEMLTGRLAAKVRNDDRGWAVQPSTFDARLKPFDQVVLTAMHKDPKKRYESAQAMLDALKRAAERYESDVERTAQACEVSRSATTASTTNQNSSGGLRHVVLAAVVAAMLTFGGLYASAPTFRADVDGAFDRVRERVEAASAGESTTGSSGSEESEADLYSEVASQNVEDMLLPIVWAKAFDKPRIDSSTVLERPSVVAGYRADVVTVQVPHVTFEPDEGAFERDALRNPCKRVEREADGKRRPSTGVYLAVSGRESQLDSSAGTSKLSVDPGATTWFSSNGENILMVKASCAAGTWPETMIDSTGSTVDQTRSATFVLPKVKGDSARKVYGIVAVTAREQVVTIPFGERWAVSRSCSSSDVCVRPSGS